MTGTAPMPLFPSSFLDQWRKVVAAALTVAVAVAVVVVVVGNEYI